MSNRQNLLKAMKKYLEGDIIEVFEVKEIKRTLD